VTTFLVVGEALVDVIVRPDGSRAEHVGGSPANVALGLGRLGNEVTLLTLIGDDDHGALVRKHLSSAGVGVIGSTSDGRTATATATIHADGSATYDFDLTWDVDIALAPDADADVLHIGSIGATVAPGSDEVRLLVTVRRASSVISFDPNIRPALVGPRDPVVRRVEHLVVLSDIVKVSAEDLSWLYPAVVPALSAARWAHIGGPLVVMTSGAETVVAFWHGRRIEVEPSSVEVVDTVGAGDAFMAALLDTLGRVVPGLNRDEFYELTEDVIEAAVKRATVASALTVMRAGADLPTRAELPEDQ